MGKKSIYLLLIIVLLSCEEKTAPLEIIEYDGPVQQLTDAVIMQSDSAIITGKLTTPRLLIFKNEDRELPEGFFLEFFNKNGETTATLKANYAYFENAKNMWKATGAVELNNLTKKEKLNTEELFWDPKNETINTDKFVRIESEDQILLGEGLKAAQDFSSYSLLKLTGEITLKELQ